MQLDTGSKRLSDLVRSISGVNVDVCFQCGKCSSGCPVSFAMDLPPARLVHAVQLGLRDMVLRSRAIWLCSSCQTCTTRCPQGVDVAELMVTLRTIARREAVPAGSAAGSAFVANSISNIAAYGRTFELGLMGRLKLSTGGLRQDLGLGLRMVRAGKLRVIPRFSGRSEVRRIVRLVKAKEEL